jgi:hypothetical protein
LLVVDDGAYFIRALSNLKAYEHGTTDVFRNRTYIVEQTTRGHRNIEEEKYSLLVKDLVNAPGVIIVRCRTKVDFESPFIAAALRASFKRFERDNEDINKLSRIPTFFPKNFSNGFYFFFTLSPSRRLLKDFFR